MAPEWCYCEHDIYNYRATRWVSPFEAEIKGDYALRLLTGQPKIAPMAQLALRQKLAHSDIA